MNCFYVKYYDYNLARLTKVPLSDMFFKYVLPVKLSEIHWYFIVDFVTFGEYIEMLCKN